MNLVYAHQLLVAAGQQRDRSFQVIGSSGCEEVQRMAAAGLVEISIQGNRTEPAVSIERLTDFGRTFLRAFAAPLPLAKEERTPTEPRSASCAAAVSKWRDKFVAMQMREAR
jgi:hypothetical protein